MPDVVKIAVKCREDLEREVEMIEEFLRFGESLEKGTYSSIPPLNPTGS